MNGSSWGGSEELWLNTAKYLISKGNEVDVVVLRNEPIHKKIIELSEKIKVHFIDKQQVLFPSILKRIYQKIQKGPTIVNYINRFEYLNNIKFDFILLSQGSATDLIQFPDLFLFLKNINYPYFILNHLVLQSLYLNDLHRKNLREIFNRSRLLFFVSQKNKNDFQNKILSNLSNALVVKNPINITNTEIIPWPESTIPSFAFVSRLDLSHKGHDLLFEVLSTELWKARNYKLNVYGSGPDEDYINELIRFYELGDKVFMKGYTANIRDIWKGNHILILPSRNEGLPLTIVEAMICGRPILATQVGDNSILIENELNGWIAESPTTYHIGKALEKAWHDKDKWESFGKLSHNRAINFIDKEPGKTIVDIIQAYL